MNDRSAVERMSLESMVGVEYGWLVGYVGVLGGVWTMLLCQCSDGVYLS